MINGIAVHIVVTKISQRKGVSRIFRRDNRFVLGRWRIINRINRNRHLVGIGSCRKTSMKVAGFLGSQRPVENPQIVIRTKVMIIRRRPGPVLGAEIKVQVSQCVSGSQCCLRVTVNIERQITTVIGYRDLMPLVVVDLRCR